MDGPQATATIAEARIDWLTSTARTGDRADNLREFGIRALEAARRSGDVVKPRSWQGYDGQGSEHLFVGDRADGTMVRVSGPSADEIAPDLAFLADHWSRVDYCVTAQSELDSYNPANIYWDLGQADDREQPRLPRISQARTRWGGTTTYVGQRSSAVFARCYDKHAESKGEWRAGSWRWELELKSFASEQEHARAQVQPKREEDVQSLIHRQFTTWSLPMPWSPTSSPELWRAPSRKHDVDDKERWLRDQVRGSAQLVAKIYGRERVLEALGLL